MLTKAASIYQKYKKIVILWNIVEIEINLLLTILSQKKYKLFYWPQTFEL